MQTSYRLWAVSYGQISRRNFRTAGKMSRDYNAAVAALNSLQSNFAIVEAIRKSGPSMNQHAIPEMIEWCRRLGYEPDELNGLNIVHIAGTKGKGSTSAFISSILCQYIGQPTRLGRPLTKIGLYTSPHLRSVRERIQINHKPLSEETFAKYFFEVWDRLEAYARANNLPEDEPWKPVYFRYLTLMAFHVYTKEKVETMILECGIGGEYDSTNIIIKPVVTGITSLGIDHTAMLGDTIEEIAWHKAGIMKPGVPCFTVPQQTTAMSVLEKRAEEKHSPLQIVQRHHQLEQDSIKLGLAADFQKTNGSLAIAITAKCLQLLGVSDSALSDSRLQSTMDLPSRFRNGLEKVEWGGRCETRQEGNIRWYIDGGHTIESVRLAVEWYAAQTSRASPSMQRILLFNQQTRNATALAQTLHGALFEALQPSPPLQGPLFAHAIFSTNVTFGSDHGGYKPDLFSKNIDAKGVEALSVQRNLATTWGDIDCGSSSSVQATIEDAINEVRMIARKNSNAEIAVLVTGSLHLVGGVLEVLETDKK